MPRIGNEEILSLYKAGGPQVFPCCNAMPSVVPFAAMAENTGGVRPVPKDLKTLRNILCVHTLVNGCIGSFVQALFAETLLIGCVVAVVGGFISPVGTYLVKRAAGMLSPKAALISIVFANIFGLMAALVVDHLFVMIWGFTTTTVAVQLMMQYVSDFQASISATDAEKAAWMGELPGGPALACLVGCLLGPCLFSQVWSAQAFGSVVLPIASAGLFFLPSPASSKGADAPWRLGEFSTSSIPALFGPTMLAIHNSCRDAILGPNLAVRFPLDPWTWGQLQFLGVLGGIVGMVIAPGFAAQSNLVLTVGVLLSSLLTRAAEHFADSFSLFMASTFATAMLKMMLSALVWKLVEASPKHAEQMPVLQQVQAVIDGVVGLVVPISILIAGGIDFNLCRALYFMSGLLIIAGVVFFSSTATAPANAKKGK
eukprot:s7737_g2.t1